MKTHEWTNPAGAATGVIGLGCMGMSWAYDQAGQDDATSIDVIHRALEIGCNLIDTADQYGPFVNEELVGRALEGRREQAFLATKGGLVVDDPATFASHRNGSPAHLRRALEDSLRRLRTDHVDLYQLHRVDDTIPVQETWAEMATFVQEGKVRAIGLSEVDVPTITALHAIHPVASVQSELSLWSREPVSAGVVQHCADNGIVFLAYSPLGRGFLAGEMRSPADLPLVDGRHRNPRFQSDAITANQHIIEPARQIAQEVGATTAQVALAWVRAQGEHVIPIPGTKRRRYLEDNVAAGDLALTDEHLASLGQAQPTVAGTRY